MIGLLIKATRLKPMKKKQVGPHGGVPPVKRIVRARTRG